MTALYIILGILAFIILLLMIPLKIDLEYDDEVRLKVGYLFLKYTILPQQPKKEKNHPAGRWFYNKIVKFR